MGGTASGPAETTHVVDGLAEPVEILVDEWGVPHIYANTLYDAFLVQGFNAARERLWQIDLWRRRGLGLLSEVFGDAYLERDRAARLFLFRGDMHTEWLAYGSDTKRVATAFVRGVNAFVELTRADSGLLPVEFRELGYEPAMWEPADIARMRSHGLFSNVSQEVLRARVVHRFGTRVEDLRRRREPERELTVPEGLDLSLIPDDVLKVYDLVTNPPQFTPGGPGGGTGVRAAPEGSNNWVVAGSRTATGRPLLANDPHRAVTVPSLRYIAHLSAPGMDVIGAGEPGLPGISIGHNDRIAFGLTISAMDQEDLYVYETDDAGAAYRYQDRWVPFETVTETVPVRGREPVTAQLRFTRHGPVVYEDRQRGTAFAIRAAWLEPGMAPYLGSIDYMRARSWDQFIAAMNRWGAPPENQVYADVDGNIGWKVGGLVPVRPNWDGLLPVPGDGRYEWAGFHDMDDLPAELNPARGYIATANEMNLPAGFPHEERHLGYDWYAPQRKQRIDEVLQANQALTVAGAVALQSDFLSLPARRIVSELRGLDAVDPRAREGLALLDGWDAVLAAESAAAALFEVWYRHHLRPALLSRALERIVPADRLDEALAAVMPPPDQTADARVDLDLIDRPQEWFGDDGAAVVREVMVTSLPAAVDALVELLGDDRTQWSWGRLHTSRLVHPMAPLVAPETGDTWCLGPVPRGGSGDTVGSTDYGPEFTQTGGSTWRMVVDVGNWDATAVVNSPGQSGNPGSPHYRDLLERWTHGAAFPLQYSREAVERHTEERVVLVPGRLDALEPRAYRRVRPNESE